MDKGVKQATRPRAHHGHGTRRGRWAAMVGMAPLHLLLGLGLTWSLPGRSEPKRYDPDKDTCQVEALRRAWHANLLPWEDQPEAVRQRLRQLQAAMTLDTLKQCQARGLLSADQAASLETELGLKATPVSPTPIANPVPAQSPTRP